MRAATICINIDHVFVLTHYGEDNDYMADETELVAKVKDKKPEYGLVNDLLLESTEKGKY